MNDLICYCFGYTEKDIEADARANGRSLIMERIQGKKRAGTCDCAAQNPKGR
ncbi:MAG: (2Fe-2S)-binding protein [Deltaproteobacteria bacterium]|nr:(2Fe-2S)-binding protein [Deltaproteobacteria bacterium]MBW1951148.1 (2Fe-2S)-binding protein [Deltaproteobacteria bacterium]MBW2008771.1 (2Fe-2S)-binding protein [Deltaproteobacteria bacterium]MBW2349173.1 (2Fe-2S)-binding protein [Deltaproteobacteria bacterium]